MRIPLRAFFALLLAACSSSTPDGGNDASIALDAAAAPDAGSGFVATVTPTQVHAREHVGGAGEPAFAYTFRAPVDLHGGGLPPDTTSAKLDAAVLELELPQGGGSTDESQMTSTGLSNFDGPVFCTAGASCTTAGSDGSWQAIVTSGGATREVQLAMAQRDRYHNRVYLPVWGVYLATGDVIHGGDTVTFSFVGHVTGRATDWTEQPLIAHFRYRSFNGTTPSPWITLEDPQVQPLTVVADTQPRYVRAIAPLDVAVGQPFDVVVVVTDHYGNPYNYTGSVMLTDGVVAELQFNDQWSQTLHGVSYATAGPHRIVPTVGGLKNIYHYTMAWASAPATQRLTGDLHAHSGDGGAQRKFLGDYVPGDHRGLFARTHDALRYMHEIAGHDFGTVSEHAARWDTYTPPAAVAADAVFQAGGACAGAGQAVVGLGDWWTPQQQIVEHFNTAAAGSFIAFPSFEWHGGHTKTNDTSPLHRIVLFRDFAPDAQHPLPILPGDIENLDPKCVLRFLADVGFTPDKAMVNPHMMEADSTNIDWELTYQDTSVGPRSLVDQYTHVGEIFSARAIDQKRPYGLQTLQVFEVADTTPATWNFRHGWRDLGAHVGVIGSSDNHSQMPGVNDDVDASGVNYHENEPGGFAVVLAATRDRDGIYDALVARRSYATSGIRAWLDFQAGGMPMGSELSSSAATVPASLAVMAGMNVSTVEVWAAQVGVAAVFTTVYTAQPDAETHMATFNLDHPAAPGEWIYYVRALFKDANSTADADEAAWSSPIWITWQ